MTLVWGFPAQCRFPNKLLLLHLVMSQKPNKFIFGPELRYNNTIVYNFGLCHDYMMLENLTRISLYPPHLWFGHSRIPLSLLVWLIHHVLELKPFANTGSCVRLGYCRSSAVSVVLIALHASLYSTCRGL